MSSYSIYKLPVDVLADLAEKHRNLRKAFGYSQVEMAERAGVSLGSLKRFEQTGQISLESLLKLMHVFNRLNDMDNVLVNHDTEAIRKLFSSRMR